MARMKSAELWTFWRDRLRRFQSSDLTIAAFCDWEGVSQAAFYVWRKKLQGDSGLRARKTVARVPKRPALAFVQILPSVSETHDTAAKVVMTLADGTRVDFPASDRELIAHVVLSVATAHSAAVLQGGDR
jgi:transposase-like protein